jgi:Glycosyltransferase family 87
LDKRTTLRRPAPEVGQGTARPNAAVVVGWFVLAGVLFWLLHGQDFPGRWHEDPSIYGHALGDWFSGKTPYNASLSPLYFLYPPFFLYMAAITAHLVPSGWGLGVYMVLSMGTFCALPLLLERWLFRLNWLSPSLALSLYFFSPRFTGIKAFCEMNIAGILYLLAFAGAVPGVKRNRWEWFYLAVFFAAMIKVTFLGLLVIPLLAGSRQWVKSSLCGFAVVLANMGERAMWPDLYAGYQWSLGQGVQAQSNYGYGIFGVLASYHHTIQTGLKLWPYVVFMLLAGAIFVGMLLLRRRLEANGTFESRDGHWLALVVVTALLMNPREMGYDMDIALLAAFVLLVYVLRPRWVLALATAICLPCLAVPYLVLNPHLYGVYETALVFVALGLAYAKMWREGLATPDAVAEDVPAAQAALA